ncbi:hypothetical protein OTK49_03255 [Vibrio coralliirubri]|uniref:hypothetical protein n=1 Tax=Vibrio coralliirubri TaxID=1516159 RepID=UPI002283B39D|nr:hypothetical protein [Vibrio coralliirubri]MCY9861534.1 hypothetical protein [Vibrio coralliirubri]
MTKNRKISWLTILFALAFAAIAVMLVLGLVLKWAIIVAVAYGVIHLSANKVKKDRAKKKLEILLEKV